MGTVTAERQKKAEELARAPWTIELRPYPDGSYFARVVELEGCMTEADSAEEALEHLREALVMWLDVALEHGDPLPEPSSDENYSGKIFVRTSPHLHRRVAEEADRQGVSMSQLVAEVLAHMIGIKDALVGKPEARSRSTRQVQRRSPKGGKSGDSKTP